MNESAVSLVKRIVRSERRPIALIIGIGTILCALVAFLWPPTYTARATLLPPSQEDTGFSVSSMVRGVSLPGIRLPGRTGPEDIALSVLQSRTLGSALADSFQLTRVYKVESVSDAIGELAKRSRFVVDENGLVIIEVKDRDPQRAADLANAYTDELDRFNREILMTRGRRTREFVETRLQETFEELAAAEETLRSYQTRTSSVALSPQQMSTVESGAQLFARKAALSVRLGLARQYASEGSDEVQSILRELEQVNTQISTLPDVGLELARLVREVRIQEEVYALLSAQYEEARINETKDISTLEVLDRAVRPDRRSWPRRGLLIMSGFLLSVLFSVAWVGVRVRSEVRAG